MPTYEYRCDACGHTFEIEQRITEDRLSKCPKCKKQKLVRLVGTGNFILKGGGWYADLYASVPKDKKAKSDASESKSTSSESKSESKPEPKSEAKPKSAPKSDAKPESKGKGEKAK
jgi:putative FmdB family regulatory protein